MLSRAENNPVFGIGMTIYNEQYFLPKTLESLKSQTFTNFRVFIYDDGSNDKTPNICQDFCWKDSRFHYERSVKNTGNIVGFTTVFKKLTTPYFMWMSGHDLIPTDYLQAAYEAIKLHPNISFFYPRIYNINEKDQFLEENIFDLPIDLLKTGSFNGFVNSLGLGRSPIPNNGIFKSNFIRPFVSDVMPRYFLAWDHVLFSLCVFYGLQHFDSIYLERQFCTRSSTTNSRQIGNNNLLNLFQKSWFELIISYFKVINLLPLNFYKRLRLKKIILLRIPKVYNFSLAKQFMRFIVIKFFKFYILIFQNFKNF